MNKTVRILAASMLAASATLAVAQTPSESFTETFAGMQAQSSNSGQFQPAQSAPGRATLSGGPRLSLAEMQSLSSGSPVWQLDHGRRTAGNAGAALTRSRAQLSFDDYQAIASNSGQFAAPRTGDTALAAREPAEQSVAQRPTVRERIATFFHRNAAEASQVN